MTQSNSNGATTPRLAYRRDIDGLRALAVLAVVLYHAFPNRLPGGFVGVDVFFVISGYLISGIIFSNLSAQRFSLLDFYQRRVRRLFPSLLLVMAFCLLNGWLNQLPPDFKQLGKHMAAGSSFVSNLVLWAESGYFDAASATKPLLHLWSLGIEEQFYLVWPLLLWLTFHRKRSSLPFLVAAISASFLANLWLVHSDKSTAAFYSPLSRFWELGLGSLLAWLQRHASPCWTAPTLTCGRLTLKKQNLSDAASCLGLALLLGSIAGLNADLAFPGWWATLPTGGALLVLAAGPRAIVNRSLLSSKIAVWFGLISYPLYLWHWPLLVMPSPFGLESPNSIRNTMLPLAILLAWLCYRFVENPIRHGHGPRAKSLALLGMMTTCAITGIVVYRQDGYPQRYPEEIREIAAINREHSFPFKPHRPESDCTTQGVETLCLANNQPSIFVWGDSHAESLYPGLDELGSRSGIDIGRATGCGNPPYLSQANYSDSWCGSPELRLANSRWVLSGIGRSRPTVVVLHARWAYEHYRSDQQQTVAKLRQTISQIHSVSPDSRVVVLGPVPNWTQDLARAMFDYWKHTPGQPLPPQYMRYNLKPDIEQWDAFMARQVPTLGATYLSAYQALCNANGCLTRTGPKPSDLTAVDYGHLSPAGSIYLISKLAPTLLELAKRPSRS
ncbi:acyltransferase family protein [Chromobacterium vaccinii]|uniref:acyltransferase family protein n=1 Tax=Chromobacterium vaccinii TaxID=1108595 RepID=UPI003C71B4BD